jgi:hypothetical protein
MPRWEYQTLEVHRVDYEGSEVLKIFKVNGQKAGKVTRAAGVFSDEKREFLNLPSYLANSGKEGWEVAGLSPISGAGGGGGSISFVLILKRTIE